MAAFTAISDCARSLTRAGCTAEWEVGKSPNCHANWSGVCCELGIIRFPFHQSTDPLWHGFQNIGLDAHLVAFLMHSCRSLARSIKRALAVALANFLLITLWVAIGYAPSHWLRKWGYGNVTVDGHPATASAFIAHPWDSEADAIVLVHVPAASDYFLSFGEEKVRIAGKHDYIRFPWGAWSFASLQDMAFVEPLPSHQINEFRIASPQGAIISIQF